MSTRRGSRRAEEILAVLLALVVLLAGGAALYFVATMSVHRDAAAIPSTSAGAPPQRYGDAVDRVRREARTLLMEENLPGLSAAVAVDGAIVWAEAFGWADVERHLAATPLTRFRIGTASIPLTSAAAGMLHERGRLDLDAPIQQYLPAFPATQWPFTVRQVMGHVAGIYHGRGGSAERMPGRHCTSLDQAVQIISGDPLSFQPGTRYRYSTYDWILVSAVVEKAAGEPYLTVMQRHVLSPLGMARTIPDSEGVEGRASFYFPRMALRTALGLQDAPHADYSCFGGSGAFLSTPTDLVRFGSAMLTPGFLTAETLAMLQTPLRLESGATTGYGLGWSVENVQLGGADVRMIGHRGTSSGGTTSFMTFPDLGLVVAATSNVSYANGLAPFALKIAEAFGTAATAVSSRHAQSTLYGISGARRGG